MPACPGEGEARGGAVVARLAVKVAQLVASLAVFDVDVVEDDGELADFAVAVVAAQVEAAFEFGVAKEAVAEHGFEVAAVEVVGVAAQLVQGEGGEAVLCGIPVEVGTGVGFAVVKGELAQGEAARLAVKAGAEVDGCAVQFEVVGGDEDFAAVEVQADVALPALALLVQVEGGAAAEVFDGLQAIGAVVAEVVQGDAAREAQAVGGLAQGEVGTQAAAGLDAARVQQGLYEGERQVGGEMRAAVCRAQGGLQGVFARLQAQLRAGRELKLAAQQVLQEDAVGVETQRGFAALAAQGEGFDGEVVAVTAQLRVKDGVFQR